MLKNRLFNFFLNKSNFGICFKIKQKYLIIGFFKEFQDIGEFELTENTDLFYKVFYKFFFGNYLELGNYINQTEFDYNLIKKKTKKNELIFKSSKDHLKIRSGARGGLICAIIKKPTGINQINDVVKSKYVTLEIAITDFCNLACNYCSQGTPLQKDKSRMSFDEIKKYIELALKNNSIDIIKFSGGEPTMHPDFKKICDIIRKNKSKKIFQLATNGIKLKKYLDEIQVFDQIDLTHYPKENDEIFFDLKKLNLKNIITYEKDNFVLDNVFDDDKNLNKNFNVYKFCNYSNIKKIVQGRLYNCCIAFGQSVRKNINRENISIKIENTLNLKNNLDYKEVCRGCYVDVKNEKT